MRTTVISSIAMAMSLFPPPGLGARERLSGKVDSVRLTTASTTVVCQGKELGALRGTLRVPEDRSQLKSRQIELPIVVVKSLSPDPEYPVFLCAGGPGIRNVTVEQSVRESDVNNRDVVQVGYRGIDGTPNLKHPLFEEIFRTSDMLSDRGLQQMGEKAAQAVAELRTSGLDVAHYGILDVVDDIEAARSALGYEKINLSGGSYGGAVVLTYCLRYPSRVQRAVMIEAAFPYDIALGTPQKVDAKLQRLNDLWKMDPNAVKRSPDIVQTMKNVLTTLPREWNGIPIDPSKVRVMTYFGMYERPYVNMLFDAYVRAEQGDFSCVAAMSLMYDQLMTSFDPGDLLAKTYSSVTDPQRDFISEMHDSDSIIGSPLSLMAWGAFQLSRWPVKPVVAEHPPTEKSTVETLLIYGSKEAGNEFKRRYGDMFTDARWVMFDDLGHMDVWTIIGEGMHHMIQRFLDAGVVDKSGIAAIPKWEFTPATTFRQMLQQVTPSAGKPTPND